MKRILVVIIAFTLLGCTSQKMQPLPVYETKKGANIGILNLVPSKIKHYHIGTIVFNNFEKEYDSTWDIPGFINENLSKELSKAGYKSVLIPPTEILKEQLSEHTIVEGDKYVLNEKAKPILRQLAKEYDIDMLFIIEPFKSMIAVPNTTVNVEGVGVATRNFLMIGSAEAFAFIMACPVKMQPLSRTMGAVCSKSKDVSGINMIGNFGDLTKEKQSKYTSVVKGYINEFIIELLNKSNLKPSS